MGDIKTCCRKLFLCLPYPSFSNVISAEVGVARRFMLSQIIFYRAISLSFLLFNTVSAEVGAARKSCRKLFLYLTYPSFLNVLSAEVGIARGAGERTVEQIV